MNCALKYFLFPFMIIIIICIVRNIFLNCQKNDNVEQFSLCEKQCKCCAKREILQAVYRHLNAAVVVVGVVVNIAAVAINIVAIYLHIPSNSLWR